MLPSILLAAILSLSPLDGPRLAFPGHEETTEARRARCASIAADVATAVGAACGDRGEGCERRAAALLLGLAAHESGFAPDTEAPGGCWRGRDGKGPRCDSGRAATLWQMQGSAEERALWLGDRVAAAREALRRATRSLGACRRLAPEERLAAYAGGRCEGAEALRRARELHAAVARASRALPTEASTIPTGP
jgi:hypothetical protein